MFVGFDLPLFLLMALLSTFVPGAIISYSLFRKDEMPLLEKMMIGFAVGMVLLPMVPFLAYLVLGMDFTPQLALAAVAILYIIAIALFAYTKSYEDILSVKLPSLDLGKINFSNLSVPNTLIISLALLLILALSYMARIGSFSPVYQELDPYYYTYIAHQILSLGHNPFNDMTSWYPEVTVNHRDIPMISYLETTWYSIYTNGAPYLNQGGTHDNMLLADIASMYPPIAAVLAVFFIYLLLSSVSRREFGIIAAGIAAFLPVFIYKLSAGEQEVQPYAFFALFFFYAMFALSLKRKNDLRFPVLAGLAFAALALGSSSQILAMAAFMIFMAIQPTLLFLRGDDPEEIRHIIKSSLVIFIIGPLLGSFILRDIFQSGAPTLSIVLPFFTLIAYAAVLYLIRTRVPDRKTANICFAAIILAGLLLYAFTPAGNIIKNVAKGGFNIAIYNSPLDRTIAEQGDAPSEFGSQMGFVADTYSGVVSSIMWPLRTFFSQAPQPITSLTSVLTVIISGIFYPISDFVNAMLSFSVLVINKAIGSAVVYQDRANSLLLLWIFLFVAALVYSLVRFFRNNEDNLFILFMAIVIPPLLVGIIKAKYTIYASTMLAVGIAYFLIVLAFAALQKYDKDERRIFLIVISVILGISLLLSQFVYKHEALLIWAGLALILSAIYMAVSFIDKGWMDKTVASIKAAWGESELGRNALRAVLIIGVFLVFMQFTYNAFADSLVWGSVQPLYQNNPGALQVKFQQFCEVSGSNDSTLCSAAKDPVGFASKGTNYQYDEGLCRLSIYSNYAYLGNPNAAPAWENTAAFFRCQRISTYWIDSMEWLRDNTPNNSRVISWWDYGHWENYFALRNAVIRNEHASHEMIGATAHAYIDGTPDDLKSYMKAHDSQYALFDMELVAGNGGLGGKYGALNYLSCAWDNQTDVSMSPGESGCEAEHLWETVYISANPCTISTISNKTGLTAYKIYEDVYDADSSGKTVFKGTVYRPYYRPDCVNPTDSRVVQYCSLVVKAVPTYCVGPAMLADGHTINTTYYLNETYPNGDLKLNKAFMQGGDSIQGTYHMGNVVAVTLFYTNDQIWLEGGEVKSGYEDRKGKFYDSNLYKALFLNEIPGFKHDYTTPDGMVKIYKIAD